MSGPSGTKLIDLHMTDRGQTTEMFSPSRKLGAKSKLRKSTDSAAHATAKTIANSVRSFAFFVTHLAVAFVSFLAAQLLICLLQRSGVDVTGSASVIGPFGVTIGIAVAMSLLFLALLELAGVMGGIRKMLKFADPSTLDKDATAADLMKVKSNYIHFGHLPVTYDITEKGLLIRSLGDRFVAVLSISPEANVELATGEVDETYRGWYGDALTTPVLIEVEDGGYRSKLIISGFNFETPDAADDHSSRRAQAFRDALRPGS